MAMNRKLAPHAWLEAFVNEVQSRGRYVFTRIEVAQHGSKVSLQAAIRRLKQQGRIVIPRRGFYVIVPVEYRSAGSPPPSWFIDDLMKFLEQPYYVGLLSAAAIHGAGHQQPMVFQVITDQPTREIRIGRQRIEFHMNRHIHSMPALGIQTETGTMRISTPEATAYDLVRYASSAGHLDNVVTVLDELADKIDVEKLEKLAASLPAPVAQRLGYLLDRIERRDLSDPLASSLRARRLRPIPLAPGRGAVAQEADPRWRVIPNVTLEPDL
jgi:predicted transcriptional regulator of viral defense system